jgi:hypothetical protein
MMQFLIRKCKNHPVRKRRSHFAKFGPCYLLGLATLLIMCDLTRHLINDDFGTQCQDRGAFDKANPGASAYNIDKKYNFCYSVPMLDMDNPDGSLSTVGLWSSVIFTWSGFILMFVSIFWGIDFHRKLRMQWRRNRGTAAAPAARAAPLLADGA